MVTTITFFPSSSTEKAKGFTPEFWKYLIWSQWKGTYLCEDTFPERQLSENREFYSVYILDLSEKAASTFHISFVKNDGDLCVRG